MQAIKDLQKKWRDEGRFRGLHANLALERDGVVLGATLLAKRTNDGALDCDPTRTLTLLAVAQGQPVDASILTKISLASKHARAGNEAMAAMHVALAGLPMLRDPEDAAERLFITDGLLSKGVRARDIWTALEFGLAPLDALEKFNRDEPRVPAGSGRPSGRWTRDGGEALEAPQPAPPLAAPSSPATAPTAAARALEAATAAARIAAQIAARLAPTAARAALRVAPPVTLAYALLDADPTGGARLEGGVAGRPDLYWSRHQDETFLRINRRSDDQTIAVIHALKDGTYVDDHERVVGRRVGNSVLIDPIAFPTGSPNPKQKRDEPDLCPKPTDDRAGRVGPVGEKDKDYEDHVKRIVNPDDPTGRGMGYKFPDPFRPRYPVIYDDCRHKTGDLIEAKGTGYAAMLAKPGGVPKRVLTEDWLRQATNQINASQGRRVEWYFAEKEAADYARKLFKDNPQLARIHVMYEYWREGMP